MQVWNVLHAARWKYRTPKIGHLGTIAQISRAVSSELRHVLTVGKKLVKQQCLLHMSLQYDELQPASGWDRFLSLGHSSKFQRVLCFGSVTARQSSSGRQSKCGVDRVVQGMEFLKKLSQRAPPIFGRRGGHHVGHRTTFSFNKIFSCGYRALWGPLTCEFWKCAFCFCSFHTRQITIFF